MNEYIDSYDNEGFVPDFINYNFNKTQKGDAYIDNFRIHKKSRKIKSNGFWDGLCNNY